MNSLEQLKEAVKKAFDGATDKQLIDTFSNINSLVDGVQKEQEALESKDAELIKSYKDIIAHTSFKPVQSDPIPDQVQTHEMPDVEDFFK